MDTYIINLISGPGSGKTTMAALLFAEMKIKGYNVEYVQEYAKKLVWLKDFDKLNNQYLVSKKQADLFNNICGNVNFIVTDGSLLHGLYYNKYNKNNVSNIEKTEDLILNSFYKFKNINIFIDRGEFPYEQAGRIENFQEAKIIDNKLLDYLDYYQIPFIHIQSNRNNINQIINYIQNKIV